MEIILKIVGWIVGGGLGLFLVIHIVGVNLVKKTLQFSGDPIPNGINFFRYTLENRFIDDEYQWYVEDDYYVHGIIEIDNSIKYISPNPYEANQYETFIIHRLNTGAVDVTFLLRTKDRSKVLNRKTETFVLL